MYAEYFLKVNVEKKTNIDRAIFSEAQVAPPKPHGINMPDLAVLSVTLGFFMGGAAIFFIISKKWTVARNKRVVNIKKLNQVPCKNCQYFSGNHYLKCAVHPAIAFTEDAIDCSDYCPQNDQSCH